MVSILHETAGSFQERGLFKFGSNTRSMVSNLTVNSVLNLGFHVCAIPVIGEHQLYSQMSLGSNVFRVKCLWGQMSLVQMSLGSSLLQMILEPFVVKFRQILNFFQVWSTFQQEFG